MILKNDKNRDTPDGDKGTSSTETKKQAKKKRKTIVSRTVGQLLL